MGSVVPIVAGFAGAIGQSIRKWKNDPTRIR